MFDKSKAFVGVWYSDLLIRLRRPIYLYADETAVVTVSLRKKLVASNLQKYHQLTEWCYFTTALWAVKDSYQHEKDKGDSVYEQVNFTS